ncbi:acyl--CoA ligase [uncultured Litoreibacter sp.]|uniref:acyl--CoA ligase n=1 Tax=uncultured Litoreibacter sp. TaxID=1392394 RepID=UPI0026057E9A|nr:acyl--CoA ligase [uncultured Litoreibacter sp.]
MPNFASLIADHDAPHFAIGAPGRAWLSYGALRDQAGYVAGALHGFGIGRGDRVAIVLPNGPEMASAFVCVAQAAVTAPLNPGYKQDEYAFYLDDLKARALVVMEGYDGPALAAALGLGIAVIRLHVRPEHAAGAFTLALDGEALDGADTAAPGPGDVALILHTSGTTSRPKIVPLLHSNVVASARNIEASLALTAQDRCMNVMPLFHIHGLIAAVSATLAAGGQVWCAPGFDALKFFTWMEEAAPSWYTAVPTMHQAILSRAPRNAEAIAANPLRFLRSSSASLPPQVFAALETTFNAPVIEGYGMTEATHQMASNPLPPRAQKPGSVGVEAGPQVRIAHEAEPRLITGTGEIVISGPNVTPGYENNDKANADNFFTVDGQRWFRTGDQGQFDVDGYLSLTGRLKEIINRGGEKISPLEIDEMLMDHPDVAQVVSFAVPHPKLGEEVGAAIVLSNPATTEADLKAFAETRVAAFKIPKHIVIMDEIPKGATGKMQRIGMAEKLGLTK